MRFSVLVEPVGGSVKYIGYRGLVNTMFIAEPIQIDVRAQVRPHVARARAPIAHDLDDADAPSGAYDWRALPTARASRRPEARHVVDQRFRSP